MEKVKFAKDWDHHTPEATTAYLEGMEISVTNDVAAAAREAGVLESEKAASKQDG